MAALKTVKFNPIVKKPTAARAQIDWSVYILRCAGGTLYTGIAKDVKARIQKHNTGRGAAYTRSRRPVRLAYQERGFSRSEALTREAGIKNLSRVEKLELLKIKPFMEKK